jgi:hypothetical protein
MQSALQMLYFALFAKQPHSILCSVCKTTALYTQLGLQISQHQQAERVMGIEPISPAWKAGALPLSYTRGSMLNGECSMPNF